MLLILNKEHFNSQQMSCIETSTDKTNPEYIHIINSWESLSFQTQQPLTMPNPANPRWVQWTPSYLAEVKAHQQISPGDANSNAPLQQLMEGIQETK